MIYVNKDTGDKAIIVERFQGVIYLKYVSGVYEGSTFPIYSNLFDVFWIKEG